MPIKRRIALRNVSSVVASKTTVIDLPIGPRYHAVILQHGHAGTDTIVAGATNLADIRVKVNGRVQRYHSGTQLRDLNNLMGTFTAAKNFDFTGTPGTAPGISVPIFFAEPWRKSGKDQDALAWYTNLWQSFQIEVDLGAASTPTLVAWAIVDDSQADKPQAITKVIRQSFAAAGTSYDIATLDRRDWLTQLTVYPDSGGSQAPSKVTLRKDGTVLHELSASANLNLNQVYGMNPVLSNVRTASVYDLVCDVDDLLNSAVPLDGARDLVLTVEAASAMSGNQTVVLQRIGLPE